MRLKKLVLENIRSYKTEEVVFPNGYTLLSGDIGSGKTTILLAIEFAFFGLQPGQKGSLLLANGANKGSIKLECEIDDKEICIERSLIRKSRSVTQDFSIIEIDGVRHESSVTETKSKILDLLNYPQEFIKKTNMLYRYTVYTPQEEMKQIVLEHPEIRLNILRNIFGIEKYKKIRENLHTLCARLREEARFLQGAVSGLDENVNKLESSKALVDSLAKRISYVEIDIKERTKNRLLKENELKEVSLKIKEKEKFESEVEKTQIILNTKLAQIEKDADDIEELKKKIYNNQEIFDERIYSNLLEDIKLKKIDVESQNKLLISISGKMQSLEIKRDEDVSKKQRIFKIDICPTCLQDVSETHKHNIKNETESQIRRVEKDLSVFKDEFQITKKIVDTALAGLEKLENDRRHLEILKHQTKEIELSKKKLDSLKKSRELLKRDCEFLRNHISLLKESISKFGKYDNIYRAKEKELKVLLGEEKMAEIELAETKKEIEFVRREIKNVEDKIEEIKTNKAKLIEILDIEKWLSKDFLDLVSFIERSIMVTLRKEFAKLFDKWFSMLTTDSFHVNLDENFTPIITQGDFELDYTFLSGGERTAIALAYRLALNQIINSLLSKIKTRDVIILDEPTDGFSEQQLNKVRDILQELKVGQLILVSHEPKIESFVDNVIKLRKEGGISEVEPKTL